MGRVTREEGVPPAPRARPPPAERVDGVPFQPGGLRCHAPGRHQPPGGAVAAQFLDGHVRPAHELEPPSSRAAVDRRGRLGRVAVLGDEGAPLLLDQRLVVHHQPVGLEPGIPDVDAELGADGAVGAIGADEPPRPDLRDLGRLLRGRQRGGHSLAILGQVLEGPAAVNPHPRRCQRQVLEGRLEVGLVEAVGVRPSRLGGPVPVHGLEEFALAVAELVPAPVTLGRFEQVGVVGHEPRRLENAERLMVDGACPRRRVPLRPALYDGHLQAGLTEEDCG